MTQFVNPKWRSQTQWYASRQEFAELCTSTCCVYGCERDKVYFVGSRGCWLYFCSHHREIAVTLNRYFAFHPNARPKRIVV